MTRGRVREFDAGAALDQAVELFWRQGYEGTSVAQLTAAMGINPPSLYAAFGSKRELFSAATDRFIEGRKHYLERALAEPTAWSAARQFLVGTAEAATEPGRPAGCFTVQAAMACSDTDREVALAMAERRLATRLAMQRRFEQAVAGGDLASGTDCVALGRYVTTVAEGINVQAASGAGREELLGVAETAMIGMPGREARQPAAEAIR